MYDYARVGLIIRPKTVKISLF